MNVVFLMVVSVSVFCFATWGLVKVSNGRYWVPGPLWFAYVLYLGYVLLPSWVLFLSGSAIHIGIVTVHPPLLALVCATTVGLGGMALGGLFGAAALGWRGNAESRGLRERLLLSEAPEALLFWLPWAAITLLGCVLTALFIATRGLPIMAYFSAEGHQHFYEIISKQRIAAVTGAGFYLIGLTELLPISALLLYAHRWGRRGRLKAIFVWLYLAAVGVLTVGLSARGYLVLLVLFIIVVDGLLRGGLPWKRLFVLALAVVAAFMCITAVTEGLTAGGGSAGQVFVESLGVAGKRLVLGAAQAGAIIQYFSGAPVLLHGRGYLWDMVSLLPGPQVGFNNWMFLAMNPGAPVSANVTPTIVGEAFANFGWWGTALVPFVLGVVAQVWYVLIVRACSSTTMFVAALMPLLYLAKSVMNGFGGMLASVVSALVVWALVVVIRSIAGSGQRIVNSAGTSRSAAATFGRRGLAE